MMEEVLEAVRSFGAWLFTEATPSQLLTLVAYIMAMRILCRVFAPVGKRLNFFLEELTYFIQENMDSWLDHWAESMYNRIQKRN